MTRSVLSLMILIALLIALGASATLTAGMATLIVGPPQTPTVTMVWDTMCHGYVSMAITALNVRATPWGTMVGQVWRGQGVLITAQTRDADGAVWYHILYSASGGWVYAGWVGLDRPVQCAGLEWQ